MQIGGGSMIFMQGKWGGRTHIRELCYTKRGKGERVGKKFASQ